MNEKMIILPDGYTGGIVRCFTTPLEINSGVVKLPVIGSNLFGHMHEDDYTRAIALPVTPCGFIVVDFEAMGYTSRQMIKRFSPLHK